MNDASRAVVIDCFPEALERYRGDWAVVAVDVIRATTTAVTAAWTGRRCFPVPTLDDAVTLAAELPDPLLVGELGGSAPYGFHLTNSPAAVAARTDVHRPMVLLSTSGTRLLRDAAQRAGVYAACLRNARATAAHLARLHRRVAVIGAGTRGEFRGEDQLGCARIAAGLIEAGFRPLGDTADVVARWRDLPVEAIAYGRSATYLRRTGQLDDIEFVLTHEDDVDAVFPLQSRTLATVSVAAGPPEHRRLPLLGETRS